jgi:hypothetical protein
MWRVRRVKGSRGVQRKRARHCSGCAPSHHARAVVAYHIIVRQCRAVVACACTSVRPCACARACVRAWSTQGAHAPTRKASQYRAVVTCVRVRACVCVCVRDRQRACTHLPAKRVNLVHKQNRWRFFTCELEHHLHEPLTLPLWWYECNGSSECGAKSSGMSVVKAGRWCECDGGKAEA